MFKNVAGQKVAIFAWDAGSGAPKTGDAGNIAAQLSLDGGASQALADANPTELDPNHHPGVYLFDLAQAETNADLMVITARSASANVEIRPILAYPTLLTGTKAACLDAGVSTRLAAAAYQAPDNAGIAAVKARTDLLPADPASQAAVLAAIAALHDLTVGELLAADLSDALSFPANSVADLLRKMFWTLCNRLVIDDATGAFTGYKCDGVSPAATGTIADDGTSTERSAPTWP